MSPSEHRADGHEARTRVRIPADTDREDRLIAGLTARQLAILASGALVCWVAFTVLRHHVSLPVLGAALLPAAGLVLFAALGRVEGLAASRIGRLVLRHTSTPHRLVVAPDGIAPVPALLADQAPRGERRRASSGQHTSAPLRLPLQGVDEDGVVDLGAEGTALVCRASAVSFSLRTLVEQEALIAGFARYLNSLEEGVQVLVRSECVELDSAIAALEDGAGSLSSLGLERAALEHAAFLDHLSHRHDLLRREVLLVLRSREPSGTPGSDGRLRRRFAEAETALQAAGVRLEVLEGSAVVALLSSCLEPFGPTLAAGAASGGSALARVPGLPGATVQRRPR